MHTVDEPCPRCCGDGTVHRLKIDHRTHLILTALSAGLWSISWLAVVLSRAAWPFRCKRCGARMSAEALRAGHEFYGLAGHVAPAGPQN